jgi:hypothetical protein
MPPTRKRRRHQVIERFQDISASVEIVDENN